MPIPASLLCPIDFSAASLGALHYALAIARRFHASLTVLTVDDPLLVEVADTRLGVGWSSVNSERQLRELVDGAERGAIPVQVSYLVRTGKAAPIILEISRATGCQLIVMSTHGRTGVGKFFLGATAERVLRETTVPVLLAPEDPGARSLDQLAEAASSMLVPVDFSWVTQHQVKVAAMIADALHLRVMIGHVLEPLDLTAHAGVDEGTVMSERHRRACRSLQSFAIDVKMPTAPEILVSSGKPADEIARWIRDQRVGLLVMALHSGPGRPRMGSVTYRAITMSRVLTLALPPHR